MIGVNCEHLMKHIQLNWSGVMKSCIIRLPKWDPFLYQCFAKLCLCWFCTHYEWVNVALLPHVYCLRMRKITTAHQPLGNIYCTWAESGMPHGVSLLWLLNAKQKPCLDPDDPDEYALLRVGWMRLGAVTTGAANVNHNSVSISPNDHTGSGFLA